uniref:Ammonium transporter AmtB-like domain-containing protein n=1 Tax=Timema shepardi TaxID=629360 RepID=A0A7R9AXR5_TIMSH|nr:unnamed protein product [Timema shepardi]
MQCGFACLEAGSVRSKNVTNIIMKNLLDMLISALFYWLIGYALAYGDGNSFMGLTYWAGIGLQDGVMAHWFFQFVFAATAATIVSGAVAERCNFFAYLVYSGIISVSSLSSTPDPVSAGVQPNLHQTTQILGHTTCGFTYPIVAHWVWSPQGWLLKMGYRDFAGCGAVHLMAGACSLVASVFLGPRIGRFDSKSGEKGGTDDFAGHSLPLVGIGGLLLMTGFLAFNGGSLGTMVGAGDSGLIARVICNTVMGGSGGGLLILAACKLGMFGPPAWSFAFTLNAALIGIGDVKAGFYWLEGASESQDFAKYYEVSVTAGVNEMSLWTSFVSGLFGGPVYVALHYLVLKMKVDDPLDAVAVHLGGGIWGLLAASIFSNNGLIFGDIYQASMLLANRLIGALAIFTWTVATCSIMFGILKALNLMRVTAEQELQGLDASLHREIGYPRSAWEPNFQIPETKLSPISSNKTDGEGDIDDDQATDWSSSDEDNENIDDKDENHKND